MNREQPAHMPHWARRADEYGKKRWYKEKPVRNRRGEYIGAIIWNLVWFYIVNHLTEWDVKCITPHFSAVLWALNMNIFIQIGGNILMLLLDLSFVRYLSRIILETANFLLLIILYYIYPLDFSSMAGLHFLDLLIPWLMIIGMIVSALKVLGNTWKLIFWR